MKRDLVATFFAYGASPSSGSDVSFALSGPLAAAGGRDDGQYELVMLENGAAVQSVAIDVRRIGDGMWSLLIGHRSIVVDIEQRKQGLFATSRESNMVIAIEDANARKMRKVSNKANASGESLKAPIAGKVVKVAVAVGDVVASGQSVVVLEAMKMENELAAERGGTVKSIHKQAGQSVEIGELLVELG